MSDNSPPSPKTLRGSLTSLQELERSVLGSALLMIIGVAVVIGSFVYAITRLRPLEIQISERQGQLKIAEEQLSATREKLNDADEQLNLVGRETAQLGDKSRKLKDEIETAQEQLSKIGAKTNDASAELKKIANGPLPGNARPMIETAISNIDEIVKHIKGIEGELGNSKEGPPSKSNGDRSSAIADLFSDQASMRIKAYSVLMDNYSTDPNLIPELLLFARKHLDNENGIYNTLVVLSHLDKKQTKPQVNEIKALAQQVEGKGPKIKERVDKLLNRLPG